MTALNEIRTSFVVPHADGTKHTYEVPLTSTAKQAIKDLFLELLAEESVGFEDMSLADAGELRRKIKKL